MLGLPTRAFCAGVLRKTGTNSLVIASEVWRSAFSKALRLTRASTLRDNLVWLSHPAVSPGRHGGPAPTAVLTKEACPEGFLTIGEDSFPKSRSNLALRAYNQPMITQPDEIIYDRRRKRLMLQVLPGGKVVLKAPVGTPKRQITNFLEQHAGWIAEKRALMAKVPEPAQALRFVVGELLWLAGKQYPLQLVDKGVKGLVFKEGQGFFLARNEQKKGAEKLEAYYREYTRKAVTAIAEKYAKVWGLQVKSIRITGAKRRWGSCSRQNSLNFSLRLAMVPPEALEYVAVHELAHTRHHDHSLAFWTFLGQMLPGFEVQRRWLKQNGLKLPDF